MMDTVETAQRPSQRILRRQRWALAMLVAAGMLNYVDRATLAVANKVIQTDLNIPIGRMGLLLSVFLWAYAFSQLPAGALIDRFGPRKLLSGGLVVWSLAQAVGGVVIGFGQFAIIRAALGVGESPLYPSGARVVRDWFAVRERGFATGICQASSSLGSFIAIPLLTFLMLAINWRWMFILIGIPGIVLAFLWTRLHRDPADIVLTTEEIRYLTDGDHNRTPNKPSIKDWKLLFSHRTTWGMIAGFFGTTYTLWLYTSWLPFYLEHERNMSIARVGVLASIPFFFGFVGGVAGGWLCDLLAKMGMTPMKSRKLLVSLALSGITLCTIGTVYCQGNAAVLALISISMLLTYVASSVSWATVPIAAPSHLTASLGAIQNFGGYVGGALAPMLTGFIVQHTGSFSRALLLNTGITLVAVAVYIALVRDPIPIEPATLSGSAEAVLT